MFGRVVEGRCDIGIGVVSRFSGAGGGGISGDGGGGGVTKPPLVVSKGGDPLRVPVVINHVEDQLVVLDEMTGDGATVRAVLDRPIHADTLLEERRVLGRFIVEERVGSRVDCCRGLRGGAQRKSKSERTVRGCGPPLATQGAPHADPAPPSTPPTHNDTLRPNHPAKTPSLRPPSLLH